MSHILFRLICPSRPSVWKVLFVAGMMGLATEGRGAQANRLYVDLRPKPDASALTAFDLNVILPDAEVDLEAGHAAGRRFVARLGEVMRLRDSQAVVGAVRRGFNGLLFRVQGTVDAGGQIEVIREAASAFPDKEILLEGDFWHLKEIWPEIHGVFAEGVFQGLDEKSGRALPLHPRDSLPLQQAMVQARKAGLATYVMDFGNRLDTEQTAKTVSSIRDLGAVPFVTDTREGGIILGPWRERAREIVVLHGWNPENCAGVVSLPEQTTTARRLHAPFEWLGYRLRYIDVGREALPGDLQGVAGVVLDGSLLLTRREQADLAAWIPDVIWEKVPLLLAGQPWTDSEVFDSLRGTLHLGGTGEEVPGLKRVSVSALDSRYARKGATNEPSAAGFMDLTAPEGSEVLLAARGDSGLKSVRFDQAFITRWGAGLLDDAGIVNERAFLSRWMAGAGVMPVPDTTTRDGRRLLMIQTRSEGFTDTVSVAGLPTCGELMKKRILDRYMLPFTVGLCEAELHGWLPGLDPRDAPRYEQTALQIFSLPQVEPASATFTRPMSFAANASDVTRLNDHASDDRRGFEREIAGSLAHLHRTVLPAGKPLGFLQWPEGSSPSADAAAFARRMGVAALVEDSGVAGTRTFLDASGAARIHREMLRVTDDETAFREAATAPRLTPLAFEFSFEDALNADAFSVVEKRLDLCASLPLQPIGSAEFTRVVEDAVSTRILELGEGHWIVFNAGRARTLRLPVAAGLPDLRRCTGVTGFTVRGESVYVHTLGRASAEIVTSPAGSLRDHLRLEESGAPLRFHLLTSREAEFEFEDLRAGDVVFAGMQPESVCHIRVNNERWSVLADANGRVRIDLPPTGYASLSITPPAYAASR